MNDSIPICRTILKHWIYEDAEYLKVWLTMLSKAKYTKDSKSVLYKKSICILNYGQFIYGRKEWSKKTKVSEQRLRGLIKKLLTDNMLVVTQQSNHFTVFEIVNYAKFNHQQTPDIKEIEGLVNQQLTISQPTTNQQLTTNEESKEGIKKVKNVICAVAQFKPPTIEEVKEYCLKRNNNVDASKWHDFYSSKGWMVGRNKMKDWQAAVRTWEHKDSIDKAKKESMNDWR